VRLIDRMLGHREPPIQTAPPPLPPKDAAELAAAKVRIPGKWSALDALIEDFQTTDRRLRIDRR